MKTSVSCSLLHSMRKTAPIATKCSKHMEPWKFPQDLCALGVRDNAGRNLSESLFEEENIELPISCHIGVKILLVLCQMMGMILGKDLLFGA